jgi:putative spermidine/putrescine transport system permease protein
MRRTTSMLLVAPAAVAGAMFFALPLGALFVDALGEGGAAFARVFALPTFWPSLAGSAVLTVVAASVSTFVGLAVAVHLASLPERPRTLLAFVIALPLTFSGLIVAYGFILGWGRAGFFTQLLALAGADAAVVGGALFTPVGLAFASSYYLIPRVVMALLPVLVNFDRTQLLAAESLGATRAQAFRQVLLPQIAGPLAGAAAALALLITAACSSMMAAGEAFGSRHERHLAA